LDGDGFTVLEEYLFGLEVHGPNRQAFTQTVEAGHLNLRWKAPRSGARHEVQASGNLRDWVLFNDAAPQPTGEEDAHHRTWQISIPMDGAPQRFFRITSELLPGTAP